MSVRGFVFSLFAAALLLVAPASASAAAELEVPGTSAGKFGQVQIGDTPTKTFTLKSVGTDPISISATAIYFHANNSEYFTITNDECSGETLDPAETCQLTVKFDPSVIGFRYTSVRVDHSGADGMTFFGIDGTGVNPGIQVTPSSQDFGTVEIGFGSPSDHEITITSTGTTELDASPTTIEGDDAADFTFYLGNPICTYVTPSSTCPLRIRFNPTAGASGERSANLVIKNNTKGNDPVTIPLTGTAIKATFTPSETSVAFGDLDLYDDPALTRTVAVESDGTANLWVFSDLSGGNSSAFSLDKTDCATQPYLQPEESCDLVVTVKAGQLVPGTYSTNLQITPANAPAQTLPVSATVVTGGLSTGDSLELGSVEKGHQHSAELTLTSTGTSPLNLETPVIDGADSDQFSVGSTSQCDGLTDGETCQVSITFSPTSVAGKTAGITFNGNFVSTSVLLTGRGMEAFVNAPFEVTFPETIVGSETVQSGVLISNGDAPFDLGSLTIEGPGASSFSVKPQQGGCTDLVRGEECGFEVTFKPTQPGSHQAFMKVAGNIETQMVPLAGTARALTPPKVSMKVSGAGKVRRGKVLTLTAKLTNSGEATATGVVIKTAVPKKLAAKVKPVTVGEIASGKTVTRKIRIKVKKSAKKGTKLKATVTVSGTNLKTGKTGRTTTVR